MYMCTCKLILLLYVHVCNNNMSVCVRECKKREKERGEREKERVNES